VSVRRSLALNLVLGCCMAGAAGQEPLPADDAVLVAATREEAESALRKERQAGRGYVVDLARSQGAQIVAAKPAEALTPGRYRLHAFVGSTPHGHMLVDAVELVLKAGMEQGQFGRERSFPKPGKLGHVWLDFTVNEKVVVPIEAAWLVGDSMLDLSSGLKKGEARRLYLAQRQDAINRVALSGRREKMGLDVGGDGGEALLELEPDAGPVRLRQRTLNGDNLPEYRLALAGLAIERLCPVHVSGVGTDRPAYPAGETAEIALTLENLSGEPVEATMHLEMTEDESEERRPLGEPLELRLAARERRRHVLPERVPLSANAGLGHFTATVLVGDLRPATAAGLIVVEPPRREPRERPRKAFAHYMGCWPVASGPIRYERETVGKHLKHEATDEKMRSGGHVRNYDLAPPRVKLGPVESADLEIRRALRIGIDGFAVDAWAGSDDAKRSTSALFAAAEKGDHPFEITICIDPMCGGNIVGSVRWLLDNHGNSPKLARRDGKPLVFGYQSVWCGFGYMSAKGGARSEGERLRLRSTPLGWHLMGHAYLDAERQLGRDIYWHYGMSAFFFNADRKTIPEDGLLGPARVLSRYVDAIGGFVYLKEEDELAKVAREEGIEWAGTTGMYQKENIPFECYMPRGTEWVDGRWDAARRQDATLVQFITWNDYGENTNIAPGYDTRYTLYDLTGYHIAWWKTGKQPEPDHDRVYLTYAKYPRGAKVWPFREHFKRDRALEVLTILPQPATIRLPGRHVEYEAPAGPFRKQFALTPGPVVAEVVRRGKVAVRLASPEPITDRPFRDSNGMVCFSTEFERHWRADFADEAPFLYSEYGDVDEDGLPNWFEMYWFSEERGFKPAPGSDPMALLEDAGDVQYTRWLDLSTAHLADPDADPDRDGRTNLQEYLDRTDPTVNPNPPAPGGDGDPLGL